MEASGKVEKHIDYHQLQQMSETEIVKQMAARESNGQGSEIKGMFKTSIEAKENFILKAIKELKKSNKN
ncbi:hypothetical protein FQA39_LY15458 [Lamprigera yunnana]|nr:hypothetical protein FQA39_LY15458 [Lamprigera yunnana]